MIKLLSKYWWIIVLGLVIFFVIMTLTYGFSEFLTVITTFITGFGTYIFKKKLAVKEKKINEINNVITESKNRIKQSEIIVDESIKRVENNEKDYHFLSDDELANNIIKSRKTRKSSK